jgi:hypothetical protein
MTKSLLVLRFPARGVCWGFRTMRLTRPLSSAPGNKLAACVCLLAVLLLWAPSWAAAFQAQRMACCTGGMCPLHGHAPKKSPHDSGAQKEGPPATCEHHGRKAAMDCSMACCHPHAPAVTGAIDFVLPAPAIVAAHLRAEAARPRPCTLANSFAFQPASPPPRMRLLSL